MVHLLRELEQDPHKVFYERDLEKLPAEELESAIDKRWLRPVKRGHSYRDAAGRVLVTVGVGDGTFEAYDEDDPDADPVVVQAGDLRRWEVDLLAVTEDMRRRNQLKGSPEAIDERLVFVGDTLRDSRRIAVLLGLFSGQSSAYSHLRTLRGSLPDSYDVFVVACPSFVPVPSERRELEAMNIHATQLGEDDFAIDLDTTIPKPRHLEPRVLLTDKEEREVELHGFKSRLQIHITGRREARSANIVEVAGEPVPVTDQPFKLFMRLVVASFEKPDGYVARGSMGSTLGLAAGGYYAPEGAEQATSRLRQPFRGALKRLSANDFIEVRRGMIRISTHPRYLSCDSEALSQHHDAKIKKLTIRLAKAARTRTSSG